MTGKPSVLQLMGLQRVRHDLMTEQKQTKKSYMVKVMSLSIF